MTEDVNPMVEGAARSKRQVSVMVRGPAHPSGAPSQVKLEMVLTWDEVRATMRMGAFPAAVVDDAMVKLLEIGAALTPGPSSLKG